MGSCELKIAVEGSPTVNVVPQFFLLDSGDCGVKGIVAFLSPHPRPTECYGLAAAKMGESSLGRKELWETVGDEKLDHCMIKLYVLGCWRIRSLWPTIWL